MTFYEFAMVLVQAGLGAGAWRLAHALRFRVDDHEDRIIHLEKQPA